MTGDGLFRVVAAAAAGLGLVAIVSGSTLSAGLAGATAIATAVLSIRRGTGRLARGTSDPEGDAVPDETAPSIDLRGAPGPDFPPVDVAPRSTVPPAPEAGAQGLSPQLLDAEYLEAALRGRIAVARRALRPLSVVHVLILGADEAGGPVAAGLIAAAAEATLRESDIVGRRDDGVYVVVLEDTGEDGAVWTTERLRRHVAGTIGPRRFQAGVASYPNHGLDAEAVDANAAKALRAAQEWDRDRIEVAVH